MGSRYGWRPFALFLVAAAAPIMALAQHTLITRDGGRIACQVKGVSNGRLSYTLDPSSAKVLDLPCADVLAYVDGSLFVKLDVCEALLMPPARSIARNCASLVRKDRSVIKGDITHFMDDYYKIITITGERNVPLSEVVGQLTEDGELVFSNVDYLKEMLNDQSVVGAMNDPRQCPAAPVPVVPAYSAARAKPRFESAARATAARRTTSTARRSPVAYPDSVDRGLLEVLDFDTFKTIALDKVARLGGYIGQIIDKKISMTMRDKAVQQALALFESEKNVVQVSKLLPDGRSTSKARPVAMYFGTDLKYIRYDQVIIEWADLNYASDFEEQEDGSYVAVISIQQRFKGIIDGKEIYSDVTNKNITVTLRSYEKFTDAGFKKLWDVFLGDIGVSSTTQG